MDYKTIKENVISDIKEVRNVLKSSETESVRIKSLIELHDLLIRLDAAQMQRETFDKHLHVP